MSIVKDFLFANKVISEKEFNKSLLFLNEQWSICHSISEIFNEATIFQHGITKDRKNKFESIFCDISYALSNIVLSTFFFKRELCRDKNKMSLYKHYNSEYKKYINNIEKEKHYLNLKLKEFETYFQDKLSNDSIILEKEVNNEPLVFVISYNDTIRKIKNILNNQLSFPKEWSDII